MESIFESWGLILSFALLAGVFVLLKRSATKTTEADTQWAEALGWRLEPEAGGSARIQGTTASGLPFILKYERRRSSSTFPPHYTWATPALRSTGGTALLGWKSENQVGKLPPGKEISGRMGALFLRAQLGPAANHAEGLKVVVPSDPFLAGRFNVYASDAELVERLPAFELLNAVNELASLEPGVALRDEGIMLWSQRPNLRLRDAEEIVEAGERVAVALAGSRAVEGP